MNYELYKTMITSVKTAIYTIVFFVAALPLTAHGQIESVSFTAVDYGYFYVVAEDDTISQHNTWHKASEGLANATRIYDRSDVYIMQTLKIRAEAVHFEDVLNSFDWSHRQQEENIHQVTVDVDHNADSVEVKMQACGETQYGEWHYECNETLSIEVTAWSPDRIIIERDSVPLGDFNDAFIEEFSNNQ